MTELGEVDDRKSPVRKKETRLISDRGRIIIVNDPPVSLSRIEPDYALSIRTAVCSHRQPLEAIPRRPAEAAAVKDTEYAAHQRLGI
jgi:hypothetical protein